jgi:dienelactone hydrolase
VHAETLQLSKHAFTSIPHRSAWIPSAGPCFLAAFNKKPAQAGRHHPDMKINRAMAPVAAARSLCTVATAALIALLSGCTTPLSSRQSDAPVREFAAKGYASVEHDSIIVASFSWSASGQPLKVVLAQPLGGAVTPVVIYLPGLGEPSDSGERWRTAWASAGYAVLSVQLLDDDAEAWRSDLARAGEFKALGREHFGAAAMSRRIQRLADLVAEGRRRTLAGETPWQRLDWSNLAVAGFDLGAFTAMTVAGERVPHAEDAAGRVTIRAAIALSPYASLAAGSIATRYRDVRVPVMSVTSDIDGDLLGLVEGTYLREAPFVNMEGPDKYMLLLRGVPHAALGGSLDGKGLTTNAGSTNRPQEASHKSSDDESSQRRRGNKRGSSSDGAKRTDQPGSGEGPADARLPPGALQMRMIALEDVSTAFLDAYLRGDPLAREWLTRNAKQWLGAAGDLRRK